MVAEPLTPDRALALLSEAEIRAIRATVAAGGASKAAAHTLGVTDQTLRNQRSAAYRKLGAGSLIEALRIIGWLR